MSIVNAITLLSGLAFFLFGMGLLGDALTKVAGGKLEIILEKLSSTTFRGIILGTVVTAVIQSSSATTVMVVGFVNSGIMTLTNAIGVIMGANIGTTATGWILTLAGIEGNGIFSASTLFALIAFIGIILWFFCKKALHKNIGMILLAFSVLMNGMDIMKDAMAPLKESPAFINFMATASNPVVALIIGIIITGIMQSASATIGILQALSVTGVITYEIALPMVVGMCIGACAPILMSAIGANVNGKRTALIYLIFNAVGAVLLLIPFYIANAAVGGFDILDATATSGGIAVINTAFNGIACIVLWPLARWLEKISCAIVRDKHADEEDAEFDDIHLDPRLLEYPAVALEQCEIAINKMSAASTKNLIRSIELIDSFDQIQHAKIQSREDKVDRLEDMLGSYLVRLNNADLSEIERQSSGEYLRCLSNFERISDHAVNVSELAEELYTKKISFSAQATKELSIFTAAIREIIDITKECFRESDVEKAALVQPLESVIDALAEDLKEGHIQRVQKNECTLELGFIFNDIINNLERVADHCSNISFSVMEAQDSDIESHNYLKALKKKGREEYKENVKRFADKYQGQLNAIQNN